MSTSRSVDRLTFTYYTGQDGSEPHGPNCQKCMNELFMEDKLNDVQMVFISTPTGSLVFNYGMDAPFTMTSCAEDFLVLSCTQCAQKAIRLQLSEAVQDEKEDTDENTERKRKGNTLNADLEVSSSSSVAKILRAQPEETYHTPTNSVVLASVNATPDGGDDLDDCSYQIYKGEHHPYANSILRTSDSTADSVGIQLIAEVDHQKNTAPPYNADLRPDNSSMEDSNDKDHDLPFLHGRNPCKVNDPMSVDDRTPINRFCRHAERELVSPAKIDRLTALARLYFANQDNVVCTYCNSSFHSSEGRQLIQHLLSKDHFKNVSHAGLVFSRFKDFKKLVDLSNEACKDAMPYTASIPFVFKSCSTRDEISFEKLFNCLTCLKRSELIDEGFSLYMLRIYPNLKDVINCTLCDSHVSCEDSANGYFNHFLSSRHIAKATENKWNLGPDYGLFIAQLSNYLNREHRGEEATRLCTQLKDAACDKTYSRNCEKYKHLF